MKDTLWSRLSRFFPCFSIPTHTRQLILQMRSEKFFLIKKLLLRQNIARPLTLSLANCSSFSWSRRRKWKSAHEIFSLSLKPAASIMALMPSSAWFFDRAPLEISMKDLQHNERVKTSQQTKQTIKRFAPGIIRKQAIRPEHPGKFFFGQETGSSNVVHGEHQFGFFLRRPWIHTHRWQILFTGLPPYGIKFLSASHVFQNSNFEMLHVQCEGSMFYVLKTNSARISWSLAFYLS